MAHVQGDMYKKADAVAHVQGDMYKKADAVAHVQGDIYKKEYSGYYCVGCEAYLGDDEMEQVTSCSSRPT